MAVLVYVRPWNSDQFVNLAKGIWPDEEKIYISEHQSVDVAGLSSRFYCEYNSPDGKLESLHLNDEELNNVIFRCRLLRAINVDIAKKMIFAMEKAISNIFNTYEVTSILSITTDSYIQHLMVLESRRRNIFFYGLVPTFVNGYFRITSMGEKAISRSVLEYEIIEVLDKLLEDGYKPNFLAKNKKNIMLRFLIGWASLLVKPIYFMVKRFLLKDMLNYHFFSSQIVSSNYATVIPRWYRGSGLSDLDFLFSNEAGKKNIFIPLQMSPEATVDYWSDEDRWVDYENNILNVIEIYSSRYNIIIKEHPNVVGYRSPSFYKKLESCDGVYLADVGVDSSEILERIDAVIVCTGSVGFEAAVRGIPVYSDNIPFYIDEGVFLSMESLSKGIPKRKKITRNQQIEIVRYMLSGLSPGNFINDGSWSEITNDQSEIVAEIKKIESQRFE